jgi:hypothetical protein
MVEASGHRNPANPACQERTGAEWPDLYRPRKFQQSACLRRLTTLQSQATLKLNSVARGVARRFSLDFKGAL